MDDDPKGLPGLRASREACEGMTQERLARAVDVPTRQVQRWEKGEQSPSVWAAYTIARALGVRIERLIGVPPLSEERRAANAQPSANGTDGSQGANPQGNVQGETAGIRRRGRRAAGA